MIGLIAIIVIGVLLLLGWVIFRWVYKLQRRNGKSNAVASTWGFVAVVVLSLLITWDAIPTWIAFEYYAKKEAGLIVFKTLDQWKVENPGVAETLEPYGKAYNDGRGASIKLSNEKSRRPMNARFAIDQKITNPFLSVHIAQEEIVDTKTGAVMTRRAGIGSGNSGGLALGGDGWWKFWLIHGSSTADERESFEKLKNEFHFLGGK